MNINTFPELNFFSLEKEIRRVFQSLEKQEGWLRFAGQMSKLGVIINNNK
jgi:hypothetical protein